MKIFDIKLTRLNSLNYHMLFLSDVYLHDILIQESINVNF